MIVPWRPDRLRQTLILRRRFQHRAGIELARELALNLLPRRLDARLPDSRRCFELATASRDFFVDDEHVRFAAPQIDAHAIAGAQQREPAAGRGFGRRIEDRRRSRCAGLAPVADARQRMDAALMSAAGGRMFTTSAAPG